MCRQVLAPPMAAISPSLSPRLNQRTLLLGLREVPLRAPPMALGIRSFKPYRQPAIPRWLRQRQAPGQPIQHGPTRTALRVVPLTPSRLRPLLAALPPPPTVALAPSRRISRSACDNPRRHSHRGRPVGHISV